MKGREKRNHLLDEADKIEVLSSEIVIISEDDVQEKPSEPKIPKKNRFLACLRKAWRRFTGCMRCCTSIQVEESNNKLPDPRGTIMANSKANQPSKEMEKEENKNIKADNQEAELYIGRIVEEATQAAYQDHLLDMIHRQEYFNIQYYGEQLERASCEIPAPIISGANQPSKETEKEENKNIKADDQEAELYIGRIVEEAIQAAYQDHLLDMIHRQEYFNIQCYGEQLERASCEISAPIISGANEPSKETEKEENKNIKADNQEAELYIGRIVEEAIQAAYQHYLIRRQEYKNILHYRKQVERASCGIPAPIISGGNENKQTVNITEEEIKSLADELGARCLTEETYQSSSTFHSSDQDKDIEIYPTSQSCTEYDENIVFACTDPLTLECFTFHQKLGEGGFGKVFLATDVRRDEHVAIKVLDKRNYTERGHSFAERYILQRSDECPYLIHGLGAFQTLNFVYYVMELTTSGTLRDLLCNRSYFPLDSCTVKFIISEIICGTQFLHDNGIIHRDLKPENILLTEDGHIKITDFGLSVMGGYDRTKNQSIGTAGYAAPELMMGEEFGLGVDYFAIGAIMYELLTQKRPFPGQNPSEIKDSVIQHVPCYPRSLSHIEVDLLQGLLCKNQFNRYGVKTNVRSHSYFDNVDWKDVEANRVPPPAIMKAMSVAPNVNNTLHYAEPPNSIQAIHQTMFNNFSFVCVKWATFYYPVIIKTESLNDHTSSFKKKEN